MLRVSAAVAVPSVVRNVDEDLRALLGELADLVGKNGFVADENAEPLVSRIKRVLRSAVLKLANLLRQASGKGKQARERVDIRQRARGAICRSGQSIRRWD